MKHIIMMATIQLICKTQEEFNVYIQNGYRLKRTEQGIEYLIKEL